ncbi:hypothetical protein Tco_0694976 [Tanacetum coccineum]
MMSDHNSSDLAPQRQEMSVENVSSGLVPQGQKASDMINSDPVPLKTKCCYFSRKKTGFRPQQGFEFRFSPLLEEYYIQHTGLYNKETWLDFAWIEAMLGSTSSVRQTKGEDEIVFRTSDPPVPIGVILSIRPMRRLVKQYVCARYQAWTGYPKDSGFAPQEDADSCRMPLRLGKSTSGGI